MLQDRPKFLLTLFTDEVFKNHDTKHVAVRINFDRPTVMTSNANVIRSLGEASRKNDSSNEIGKERMKIN